ncbi:MAG: YceI family protein [Pricia sp.]
MKKFILLATLLIATIASAQKNYTLSDTSTLAIDGSSTLHDWTVTANSMEGSIAQKEDGSMVDFSVLVEDIEGDRAEAMNSKMHDALKKEAHPKVSVSVSGLDTSASGKQDLKATLTIAGVEKETTIPATVSQKNGQLQIAGEKKIVLQDYDIEPPTAMFGTIVVGDEVTVRFDLMFENQ